MRVAMYASPALSMVHALRMMGQMEEYYVTGYEDYKVSRNVEKEAGL